MEWFPEQDMQDYSVIHGYNMKSLAELTIETNPSLTYDPCFNLKQLCSSSSQMLSFGSLISKPSDGSYSISKPKTTTSSSNVQNNVVAERKRRQKLNHQFIALSAMLPCLKKKDKASVLGDAIKYVKQLQERSEVLEEHKKKISVESVVLVKKSHVSAGDGSSSSGENSGDGGYDLQLPEIEARVSKKDVLIRLHCTKQQGVVPKILNEIENLHLSIINTSVLSFGNSTLDVTIISQMDAEFSMTVKDVVRNLRLAFLKFK
ncbi:basic helix-loop-helix (bHLH) DNA-binding superfamily protein [Euphorbia peplus]|nr:basic helix-loop-helix (bHLH) DNA-binding superfamily protein [Euphorbia peplus]